MKTATWYFDFVSPFSYLQHAMLGRFAGKAAIEPVPVLFAGLLNHWGTTGPAELPAKRTWTYRHCQWTADAHGIPFRMPPAHPFNPIKPLRLAVALDNDMAAIGTIFRSIWADGRDLGDAETWRALAADLGIDDADALVADQAVKDRLRANTEEAVAHGVFGVPTFVIDGELFWGVDATDFALAYLDDPSVIATPEMHRIDALPAAADRRKAG